MGSLQDLLDYHKANEEQITKSIAILQMEMSKKNNQREVFVNAQRQHMSNYNYIKNPATPIVVLGSFKDLVTILACTQSEISALDSQILEISTKISVAKKILYENQKSIQKIEKEMGTYGQLIRFPQNKHTRSPETD